MVREYRDSRVAVTDAIRNKLTKLLVDEQDFHKKKKHSAKWYQDEVAKSLKLTEESNPSLRSYEAQISKIRPRLGKPRTEDEPWSISTLTAYPLPPETLPEVLRVYKWYIEKSHTNLTIRQAKWVSRLSSVKYDLVLPYLISRSEVLDTLMGRQPDYSLYDRCLAGFENADDELIKSITEEEIPAEILSLLTKEKK